MKKIYLSPPHLSKYEKKYISDCINSNWIAPVGPCLTKFEKSIMMYTGVKNALCVNSGTSAIHLALKALDIKSKDIVLCQNFTFIGSVYPILYCNAEPIFIGSEASSWNMCPEILRNTIIKLKKKNKSPKAIIVVHLYGMPAKMHEIKKISMEYDIPIIEDAAEALGSSIRDKKCGSFGDIGILSFNGNKIITTSGGGAIISNNKKFIEQAKHLSNQARDNFIHYEHSKLGFNYRMSNVLAAIGLGQMKVLNTRIKTRRKNYNFYKNFFENLKKLNFLEERIERGKKVYSNRWLTTVLINDKNIKVEEVIKSLNKVNIEARPLWKPMNLQPILKKFKYFGTNLEKKLFDRGLCLPSGSRLTYSQKKRICEKLKNILNLK